MLTELFDFELPPERIALRPVSPRDAARLLVVRPGGHPELEDRVIRDLPDLLQPGDALVVNDTKVIPARLLGRRLGRDPAPRIEATLVQRLDASRWKAFVRPAKKLAPGDVIRFGTAASVCALQELHATVETKSGGEVNLSFDLSGPVLDQAIADHGQMPLPPYIASRRPPDERDRSDYQTMFARNEGSVAAPTAGLHFTEDLLQRLKVRGITVHPLTLHVGPGTFLPVHAEDTKDHKMHSEYGCITSEIAGQLNAARKNGGRIAAVGSTALRLLETAAAEDGTIHPYSGETDLFVTPGYRFRVVDLLMTNFHLPRSTLFMMVAAFSGLDTMRRAYAHAIAAGYRFYSYGDACLLHRA
jgi:S-adenosylmethionine:tRNA ribosyltransferase-isomerase